jgi:hypothetical protein
MMCRKHDTALKTRTGKLDPVRFVSPESASPRLASDTKLLVHGPQAQGCAGPIGNW